VKRQILRQFHVFKTRNWDPVPADALQLQQSIKPYLSELWWLNFWQPKDPLGGHLDFYDVSPGGNRRVNTGAGWGAAHTAYWDHRPMYDIIMQTITA